MENINASDFREFKVSDEPKPCVSCGPHNPLRPPAPVVIRGEHYCCWCALEIARKICPSEIKKLR
jgi:hypothetical protein